MSLLAHWVQKWGRMCAEHALPIGWESMDYDTFLVERRRRMADLIRVAFGQLCGEATAVEPRYLLPGADVVWKDIKAVEQRLRALVSESYRHKFGDGAAKRIEDALSEREREQLARALRHRPRGADPLTIVDYLYLGQLPPLLFVGEIWQDARERLGGSKEAKQKLVEAVAIITSVRNEIAHMREVDQDRLLRAKVACGDVLKMARATT